MGPSCMHVGQEGDHRAACLRANGGTLLAQSDPFVLAQENNTVLVPLFDCVPMIWTRILGGSFHLDPGLFVGN